MKFKDMESVNETLLEMNKEYSVNVLTSRP